MRRQSRKRAKLMQEVGPKRQAMIEEIGKCERCGCSPRKPKRGLPRELSELCVHEIANGPLRAKALDKRFATLVLCWRCNTLFCDKREWPETRQLALLKLRRSADYDLVAYNTLVCPAAPLRIEPHEVERWLLPGLTPGVK